MIMVNGHTGVYIEGTRVSLEVEVTMLMKTLIEKGVTDKKSILYLVELATKSTEELKQERSKAEKEISDLLTEAILKNWKGEKNK